ncbi:MAG: hypothetical protein ACK5QT_04895 [Oligoflexia bacterium]
MYVVLTYINNVNVQLSRRAEKSLYDVPKHVAVNFFVWRREVETHGIEETRKLAGYHDEPLKGRLKGIRSVRLGRGYRAYYRMLTGQVKVVLLEDINKHDYKQIERLFGY